MDQVTDDREIVVIKRRGREAVAIVSESELSSLLETEYLFRSPKNADRLIKAIHRAKAGGGTKMTVEELRKEFGAEKSKGK